MVEPRECDCVAVGPDGVAVACDYENEACFRLADGGAEALLALPYRASMSGLLPHEDASGLAGLSGEKTLKKRVSEQARLPRLDGEDRLYPLYAAYVEAVYPKDVKYESWNYGSDPILTASGGDNPWQRLTDGEADILFAAAPDPEDSAWATFAARGQRPEFIPLCRDAVVFLVSADNPVADVSAERLRAIYAGKITDWADLGAAELGKITAYRDGGDGGVLERVCAFDSIAGAAQGVSGYDTWAGEVFTGPVPYRSLPNALGCALRSQCGPLLATGKVKCLSVDGVAPTDESVADGSYPFAETLYAVALGDNDNPNVRALLDWIQTDQGGELARGSGFTAVG